jgi:uncharacterized membrane protein YkvA (DUF1232 family)
MNDELKGANPLDDYRWREIDEDAATPRTEREYREGAEYVEANLWEKLEQVGQKISFAKDLMALFKYMRDERVAWYRKSIVVGALVYFIAPIDAIPDLAPLVGYLDDLGVVAALMKYLGSELMEYYD